MHLQGDRKREAVLKKKTLNFIIKYICYSSIVHNIMYTYNTYMKIPLKARKGYTLFE